MIIIKVMENNVENIIELYIRTQVNPFKDMDLLSFIRIHRLRISREEIHSYLEMHQLVLSNDSNLFYTRAGIFSEKLFSFKPERFEVDQGILVCGHRCMPFIDPEMLPSEIRFTVSGEIIPMKQVMQPLSDVYSLYTLWGEEYIPQFFALDPANVDEDFSLSDYELPTEIGVTVSDVKDLFKRWNFSYGDRIIAKVVDWHAGVVALEHLKQAKGNVFEISKEDVLREKWITIFENALGETLSTFGPCGSIDEQLLNTYLNDMNRLCVSYSSSVSECMSKSITFGVCQYGVESRIWFNDKEIPAWGSWSASDGIDDVIYSEEAALSVPDYVIEAFIYDSLFLKEETTEKILKRILPECDTLSKNEYTMIILLLEKKRDNIRKDYNWFADHEIASVRHKTLNLYSKLLALAFELENSGIDITLLDQHQLVVLSQLIAHISRLIGSFTQEEFITEKNLHALSVSLEGMEMSYEDTNEVLRDEIRLNKKETFILVRNREEKNGF